MTSHLGFMCAGTVGMMSVRNARIWYSEAGFEALWMWHAHVALFVVCSFALMRRSMMLALIWWTTACHRMISLRALGRSLTVAAVAGLSFKKQMPSQ